MQRKIPENYSNTIIAIHKERGREWIASLPSLITYCEKKWKCSVLDPFDLSYNYVAPVVCVGGKRLVLKLSVPNHEFQDELTAVTLYKDNNGMVNLVGFDRKKGIMLLENVEPGKPLSTVENDIEATNIAASVLKQLWKETEINDFHLLKTTVQNELSLKRIIQENNEGFGPFSKELLSSALTIFNRLNSSISRYYVLHGDLHHYNILSCDNKGWVAIDPKGLIGEREYDVIQFLLNRLPSENKYNIVRDRIEIFVKELGLSKNRILLWGYVHAILSVCWSVEESEGYSKDFYEVVDIFKTIYLEESCINSTFGEDEFVLSVIFASGTRDV